MNLRIFLCKLALLKVVIWVVVVILAVVTMFAVGIELLHCRWKPSLDGEENLNPA